MPVKFWEKLFRSRHLSTSGLRQTKEESGDRVKDLMKRTLKSLVMNDTGWPIKKKVMQKTSLQNDSKSIDPKQHLFCYWYCILMALPKWPYLDYLTYNNPTYNSLIYNDNSQAKCFSSQNLLGFLNKSAVNQLQMPLAKNLQKIEPVYINYQPGK